MHAIQSACDSDYEEIFRIASDDNSIVRHSTYTYWLLQASDPDGILVCRGGDQAIKGYVAGLYSFHSKHSLLIQISVRPEFRKSGVGSSLVHAFQERSLSRGKQAIILTIDPLNSVSKDFFSAIARDAGWGFESVGGTGVLGGTLHEETIWELKNFKRDLPNRDLP